MKREKGTPNLAFRKEMGTFKLLFKQNEKDPNGASGISLVKFFSNELYADGYQRAAEVVHNYISKFGEDNILVYPLIYLLRQSVELALKHTILELWSTRQNLDVEKPRDLFQTHDLATLSKHFRKFFDQSVVFEGDMHGETNEEMIGFLQIWEDADPEGFRFRYATDKDGNAWIPDMTIYAETVFSLSRWVLDYLHGVRAQIREVRYRKQRGRTE